MQRLQTFRLNHVHIKQVLHGRNDGKRYTDSTTTRIGETFNMEAETIVSHMYYTRVCVSSNDYSCDYWNHRYALYIW